MTTSNAQWPRPANFRDLGGIPVQDGTVRRRRVFRSDDVTLAPDDFLDELAGELGVTQVVDLRAIEESRHVDLSRLGSRGIDYHNIALGGQVMTGHELPTSHQEMAEFYCRLVDQHAAQMVGALGLIAYSPGGVVFHCAAGKDRTGMLAAFLLGALGASDEAIAADFAFSQANLPLMLARWRGMVQIGGDGPGLPPRDVLDAVDLENMPMLMTAPVEGLIMAMDLLRQRHGDFMAPLYEAGLDTHLVSGLRARLVEPVEADGTPQDTNS